MIKLILKLLGSATALIVISYMVAGITVNSFTVALIAGIVFAIINITLKPLLQILAFPINIVTLGLFGFLINAFLFWLVGYFVNGFDVQTISAAFIGSFIMSIIMWMLSILID